MSREFGDYQTPPALARAVAARLRADGVAPASVLEPTAGRGSLLVAALDAFPSISHACAVDRDEAHLAALRASLPAGAAVDVRAADALRTDWAAVLASLPRPLLVLGNPPWVTRSELGALGSTNLPARSVQPGATGIASITGRGNFDLGEWLILQLVAHAPPGSTVAMLCKTSVARRVLARAWSGGAPLGRASLRRVDARRWFDATVDACLFTCEPGIPGAPECPVYEGLDAAAPESTLAWRDGALVRDARAWDRWRHLAAGPSSPWAWRSGVKHDCAAVMELARDGDAWVNGLGERVDIEPDHVYPLASATDLARTGVASRWLLVPQRATGDDTAALARTAPRTWAYLLRHAARLDARASRIYRGRARFAVFGVGPYTFAPWKVAVSGLHRGADFRALGPRGGRATVLDDTSYALACATERDARALHAMLASEAARGFLAAVTFPDAKRPVTAATLGRLDLGALARELGAECPPVWNDPALEIASPR